jgi:tetratricopeptide (TPR) repeat protein
MNRRAGPLRPLYESRSQRVAALVVFAALCAVGFVPLFGGPGYEHAVASGVLVPSAAAISTALELSAVANAASLSPLACAARGLLSGAALAAVAFATATLHGLRVGMCDFWGGTALFVLTAGFGAVLGGAWGAVVAEVCRRRRRRRLACVLLAVSAPVAGIAISVGRFYASPMIFAYDPFFGYFSGALYDTVVDVRTELWTYRGGSVATLLGVVFIAAALGRTDQGRLAASALRTSRRARSSFAGGVAALALSLAVFIEGPSLGHWQSAATIASALGGHASGAHCDVVYPASLLPDQARLLVRDCEEELAADEVRLGAHLSGRLTAYEFADADQKRRLMGAADTSIAKPWRREVYVQLAAYPHPILGHEIAHVVAGSFAGGPFHVGGGLWPNPGLIEGLAVATSPDDDELAGAQWARAMLDLGILPPLRELFSLDFFGQNASKSYTVAGAFVAWARDRWGAAAVRAWYGGASIENVTGQRWEAIDDAFREWLRAVAMPPQAMAYARAKFERPSVWARRCPHVVDALNRAADQCRDEHRFDRAVALYDRALSRDSQDWHARQGRAWVELRYRDEARGREDLKRIAEDEAAPRTWRDRAQEAIADDDLAHDRAEQAREGYRAIAARTLDEDAARTLEVKALGSTEELSRRAVVDLLIGEPGRPADAWFGALSMGEWLGSGGEPLAAYLVGKNLALHEAFPRAAAILDRAIEAGAPTPRVGRELLRARAICACALGDVDGLARVTRLIEGPDSPFAASAGGRRAWLSDFIARCEATGP